jgi:hypothetical protein
MKYSQFLQFEEVLRENNLTVEDIKENKEALNEVGGGGIVAALAALAGLGTFFGKSLLRMGIKKGYLVKLKNISKKFEDLIIGKTSDLGKKDIEIRQNLVRKEKELRGQEGEEAQAEIKTLNQKKSEYERRFSKEVNEFITKISSIKTKEVYEKIDELKMLKQSQKTALKGYWETQIVDTRIKAFNQLIEDGIITNKDIIGSLKSSFEEIKQESKQKLENIQKEIKKEGEGDEGKPTEVSSQSVEKNINDLSAEKDRFDEQELARKVALIIKDIKKLPGKDAKAESYDKLAQAFGEDLVIKLRKKMKEEGGEEEAKPREKQSALKQEDNL